MAVAATRITSIVLHHVHVNFMIMNEIFVERVCNILKLKSKLNVQNHLIFFYFFFFTIFLIEQPWSPTFLISPIPFHLNRHEKNVSKIPAIHSK